MADRASKLKSTGFKGLDDLADMLAEAFGKIDSNHEMLKLICRHVGVTRDELMAAAQKYRDDHG